MVMEFDYSKLRGRITEMCGTCAKFADMLGLSERSLSLKLNNSVDWKRTEIAKATSLLDIPPSEICDYFFCQRSSKLRTSGEGSVQC